MESGDVKLLELIFDRSVKPRDIKLSALESITRNFSEEQKIGKGGFGTVYKGVLRNGEVAVKRIRNNHTIDEKLFRREVDSLLNVSHKNIVRFLGFCSNTEHKAIEYKGSREHIYAETRERILCFEYIKNGSLENYIADELRGLQWDARYFIVKGICEGLQYLHMEKHILHMDLKPANILIDYSMVAKITDFGLSRLEENSQTKSTNRTVSLGYTAPEYLVNGKMSVKSDVYSLGIIIIELVTGQRSISDSNNVLRRWRHRLHKSGEDTPFRCQQIAKLIEIGLLCQEQDPYKRPFIKDIIRDMIELENTKRKISNSNESTVRQISAYLEDDMLGIEPLELCFPFELNTQISCSLELTNGTNASIAFSIHTTIPLPYCIESQKDIVAPRSKYSVNITLQPIDKAPQENLTGDFIVRSTKVNDSLKSEDITEDIFNREGGKLVDEVNLTVKYKAEVPQVDGLLGPLIISDTRHLHEPHESNVPPTLAESKISTSTSDEVIQFDPPELCFPLVPDKQVLSAIKIINITESFVSLMFTVANKNTANYLLNFHGYILPPRSEIWLKVRRKEKEDAVEDMQFNDEFFVWYAIVAEDMKASDLDREDYSAHKNLPIVLTKINSCTSNELIQFDPPELSFPCLNKTSLSSVNIVNITDCYIGFNNWHLNNSVEDYHTQPARGILPPRSTRRIVIKRVPKVNEPQDMQCKNNLFLWNMIVSEGVKSSILEGYTSDEASKEFPLTFNKISPCTSDELLRLDHPGLRFTFLQNKIAMSSINLVNITDYYIGFRLDFNTKAAIYKAKPDLGILAPRSAQRVVVVAWVTNEPEDMKYTEKIIMRNAIVSESIKVSDLDCYMSSMKKQSNESAIIVNKITSSTSVELIKLEPPEVCFPFLPSKSLSSSIKIANITDYHIGFNTHVEETNAALYITEPPCGILPPWSTQELVVTRVAKEEALEPKDMQCKDKYFVFSCVVTEGVSARDLATWKPIIERKEFPIVFTQTSTNELVQFDPPELCLPLLPNQRVLSSAKLVNITDQYIGFRICTKKSNSARYYANPSEGILPPLSTQVLMVTRIEEEKELEDTQCTDKFLVWNGFVTEDVKPSDVIDKMSEIKCTDLPVVLTKTSSSTSDELIQFDPPELQFPFLPNKKVMTSIKMVNLTDFNVGFNTYSRPTNAAWYHTEPLRGILPPRSTQKLMVTREEKEDASKHNLLNDKYFVWKSIVSEGVKESDLSDYMADQESKELPIVLEKISSSTSDELIQLDPTEICIPLLLDKKMVFMVNVVNTTDFYVAFNAYIISRNAGWHKESRGEGILPPRSTKKHLIIWKTNTSYTELPEDYFVWNRIVTEGVERGDIIGYMDEEESKKLPFILNKASPGTPNELIQFDPPELSLPLMLMPNKPLVFSVNIVNSTDYRVGFKTFLLVENVGQYHIEPARGFMPPRSTQRLVLKRVPKKKEQEDMQCEDKVFLWSNIVSEGVEASDISEYINDEGSKTFTIVYNKSSLCTSDELIQLDPPQLAFPFSPNKMVSMLRKFKIVNVTDHIVGYCARPRDDNSAWYRLEPRSGILPPRSTQAIKVRRTLKDQVTEDMQHKDKILVWNGIVTEGIEASDVDIYLNNDGDKELPVVLTKPGESSSR